MGEDLLPIKQARAFRKFSYLPTHTVHTSTRRFDAMGYWTLFYIEPLSKYCRYGNEKNSVTRSFANGVILISYATIVLVIAWRWVFVTRRAEKTQAIMLQLHD